MPSNDIEKLVRETARKYGVDEELAWGVARRESGRWHTSPTLNKLRSPKGAIGPMQLMPNTAKGLGVDPYDIEQNVDGGVRYLKQQIDTFGDHDKALAAYNAGPQAVKKYGGIPPYKETQEYVKSIRSAGSVDEFQSLYKKLSNGKSVASATAQPDLADEFKTLYSKLNNPPTAAKPVELPKIQTDIDPYAEPVKTLPPAASFDETQIAEAIAENNQGLSSDYLTVKSSLPPLKPPVSLPPRPARQVQPRTVSRMGVGPTSVSQAVQPKLNSDGSKPLAIAPLKSRWSTFQSPSRVKSNSINKVFDDISAKNREKNSPQDPVRKLLSTKSLSEYDSVSREPYRENGQYVPGGKVILGHNMVRSTPSLQEKIAANKVLSQERARLGLKEPTIARPPKQLEEVPNPTVQGALNLDAPLTADVDFTRLRDVTNAALEAQGQLSRSLAGTGVNLPFAGGETVPQFISGVTGNTLGSRELPSTVEGAFSYGAGQQVPFTLATLGAGEALQGIKAAQQLSPIFREGIKGLAAGTVTEAGKQLATGGFERDPLAATGESLFAGAKAGVGFAAPSAIPAGRTIPGVLASGLGKFVVGAGSELVPEVYRRTQAGQTLSQALSDPELLMQAGLQGVLNLPSAYAGAGASAPLDLLSISNPDMPAVRPPSSYDTNPMLAIPAAAMPAQEAMPSSMPRLTQRLPGTKTYPSGETNIRGTSPLRQTGLIEDAPSPVGEQTAAFKRALNQAEPLSLPARTPRTLAETGEQVSGNLTQNLPLEKTPDLQADIDTARLKPREQAKVMPDRSDTAILPQKQVDNSPVVTSNKQSPRPSEPIPEIDPETQQRYQLIEQLGGRDVNTPFGRVGDLSLLDLQRLVANKEGKVIPNSNTIPMAIAKNAATAEELPVPIKKPTLPPRNTDPSTARTNIEPTLPSSSEVSDTTVKPVESGTKVKAKPLAKTAVKPKKGKPTPVNETAQPTFKPIAKGKTSNVVTPRGTEVKTRFAIVDADNLITSHDEGLNPDSRYPAELQPRDRTRAASEDQIGQITRQLRPSFLADSPEAGKGAPIIGRDGFVESGNGRGIAIKRVYANNPAGAGQYRKYLMENAADFGIDAKAIESAKKPVLVRVRESEIDRVQFAKEANEPGVARMSPVEQAASDARTVDTGLLSQFKPGDDGNILTGVNRQGFIPAFVDKVIGSERGAYIGPDGQLNVDGVRRIKNAVFAKAYGDSAEGNSVLQRVIEDTSNNFSNIANALLKQAGRFAQLKGDIKRGNRQPLDITPDIVAAVKKLSDLRNQGMKVGDYLKQENLFGDDLTPLQKQILESFDANARSGKKINDILDAYLNKAELSADPKQRSIITQDIPSKEALFDQAVKAAGSNKVSDQLRMWADEVEGAARKRLASRDLKLKELEAKQRRPNQAGSSISPFVLASDAGDYIAIGAAKIVRGLATFSDWSMSMKIEFPALKDEQLKQLYQSARQMVSQRAERSYNALKNIPETLRDTLLQQARRQSGAEFQHSVKEQFGTEQFNTGDIGEIYQAAHAKPKNTPLPKLPASNIALRIEPIQTQAESQPIANTNGISRKLLNGESKPASAFVTQRDLKAQTATLSNTNPALKTAKNTGTELPPSPALPANAQPSNTQPPASTTANTTSSLARKKTPILKALSAYGKAQLLASVSSAGTDMVGTQFYNLMKTAIERPIAAVADSVLSRVNKVVEQPNGTFTMGKKGEHTIAAPTISGVLRSGEAYAKGIGEGGKLLFKKGLSANEAAKLEVEEIYTGDRLPNKVADGFINTVFRARAAADKPAFNYALNEAIENQARVIELNGKGKAKDVRQLVKDYVNNKLTENSADYNHAKGIFEEASLQALDSTFAGDNSFATIISNFKEGLWDGKLDAGQLGKFEAKAKWQKAATQSVAFLLDQVAPFTKVPSNVVKKGYQYTAGAGADLAGATYRSVKRGGLTTQDQQIIAQAIGRGAIGTAMLVAGMLSAQRGDATESRFFNPLDGEDAQDRATRTKDEVIGRPAGAFKLPGSNRWIPNRVLGPLGSIFNVGVTFGKELMSDDSVANKAIAVGKKTSEQLLEHPLANSAKEVAAAVLKKGEGKREAISRIKQFTPILGMKMTGELADPASRLLTGKPALERQTESPARDFGQALKDSLKERVPGYRESLPPKIDAFGQTIPKRPLEAIDPLQSRPAKSDPVVTELDRLGMGLSKVKRDDSESLKDYTQRQSVSGQAYYNAHKQLFESEAYKGVKDIPSPATGLPSLKADDIRKDMIESARSASREGKPIDPFKLRLGAETKPLEKVVTSNLGSKQAQTPALNDRNVFEHNSRVKTAELQTLYRLTSDNQWKGLYEQLTPAQKDMVRSRISSLYGRAEISSKELSRATNRDALVKRGETVLTNIDKDALIARMLNQAKMWKTR